MALNFSNHLACIFDDPTPNRRYDIWRWFLLTENNIELSGEISKPGMRAEMDRLIANDLELRKLIKDSKTKQFLPDELLEWVNEGKRQAEWLSSKFKTHTHFTDFMPAIAPGLAGKDRFIANIDKWNISNLEKASFLSELKISWDEHKKGDKQFQWFKDEEEKCSLAGKWIKNNIHLKEYHSFEIPAYESIENYEDLLTFFDHSKLDQYQKILYIEKIKKNWSQRKYREKLTGKAQYNFILSDKAIRRLDNLVDKYDLKRTEVLEILLQMEEEKELYIKEKKRFSSET